MTLNNPPVRGNQSDSVVPIFGYRNREAEDAFAVYSALARLAVDDNKLGRLPLMAELRQIAFDRFQAAFEVL